ncbi:MAG: type III-B CRISPR-associated protein Cas10/Cmr2 [Acidobacteriota bacterium]|nr:hypothetical protein [Blastocatellia bacterium]MDW8413172.1 type III-B CRISPR-associated protein Cas10/Cmr2 [Acidobacteriota bacterium]
MKLLVVISIGPQDFIAAARRSHHLWFGSWLLSELSRAAASSLNQQKAKLPFPSPEKPEDLYPNSDFNVANKITAIVACDDVRQIIDQVKTAVIQRLKDLMKDAFGKVRRKFQRDTAKKQVLDLVEFFAAAVPIQDDLSDYRKLWNRQVAFSQRGRIRGNSLKLLGAKTCRNLLWTVNIIGHT